MDIVKHKGVRIYFTLLRVLYHALSPHKLIVFEDIVPLGYNVLRGRFANEEEVKAAYAKIAKWHAISHKIIKEVTAEDKLEFDLIILLTKRHLGATLLR